VAVLTRLWMGRVSPDWTIRVGGSPAGNAEPSAADRWAGMDDAELVRVCLDGHRDAFNGIVERHRRQIYQVCYRYVGTHEDAADLAQDTFIRAYKGLRGFKGQSSIATWLYRIAVNVCLNRLSLKTPRPESLGRRDRSDLRAVPPDSALLREERAAEVRAAIRQLPRKQRATLILRVYHDLPHEQIAAILGSSVGAAKANFFHALANLKKLLR
jgi:RNA polymerase sigma-70 factor (ECF subfamily)